MEKMQIQFVVVVFLFVCLFVVVVFFFLLFFVFLSVLVFSYFSTFV